MCSPAVGRIRDMKDLRDKIDHLLNTYPLDSGFKAYEKPKKNGGTRTITSPNKPLKKWLREVSQLLSDNTEWCGALHGGVKGKSYVTYAKPHVNKSCVVTIDIRDCFDSISEKRISSCLTAKLGIDTKQSLGLSARLCNNGKLCQGFPTSNYVSNLVLEPALLDLEEKLQGLGYCITNYVDDLAISGKINDVGELINQVALSLSRIGLSIRKDKVLVMPSSKRQVICGLVVNKKLTLSTEYKEYLIKSIVDGSISGPQLRGWLANLNMVDKKLMKKLKVLSLKVKK